MERYALKNAVNLCHALLEAYVPAARVLVDMTCGNGHDTAFLASLMADDALLYGFDIQPCAIEATQQRLSGAGLFSERTVLRVGSHEQLLDSVDELVDIIVFNLGYLPSGDHTLHTKTEITVKAIKIGLHKIAKNGIIMIAAYPGTQAGAEEAQTVHSFLQTLPQKEYDVSQWRPINQVHCPPQLYIVQKRG